MSDRYATALARHRCSACVIAKVPEDEAWLSRLEMGHVVRGSVQEGTNANPVPLLYIFIGEPKR